MAQCENDTIENQIEPLSNCQIFKLNYGSFN
jgi:hypothetical protein